MDENSILQMVKSLPSRERGLKYRLPKPDIMLAKSLPSRERGLKFENLPYHGAQQRRSLHGSVD